MAGEPDLNSTIFIVDDESVIRDSLSAVVEAMGLAVKCFSSAREVIEYIEPNDISGPDCLIADVQMPEVSGIELLEQLRASGKEFPVIMMTGAGSTALQGKAEELGAAAFLEKPFRSAELRKIIATVLGEAKRT